MALCLLPESVEQTLNEQGLEHSVGEARQKLGEADEILLFGKEPSHVQHGHFDGPRNFIFVVYQSLI